MINQAQLRERITKLKTLAARPGTVEEGKTAAEMADKLEKQLGAIIHLEEVHKKREWTEAERIRYRRIQFQWDRASDFFTQTANGAFRLYKTERGIRNVIRRYQDAPTGDRHNRDFSEYIGHLCATDPAFKVKWAAMTKEERRAWRRDNWDVGLLA